MRFLTLVTLFFAIYIHSLVLADTYPDMEFKNFMKQDFSNYPVQYADIFKWVGESSVWVIPGSKESHEALDQYAQGRGEDISFDDLMISLGAKFYENYENYPPLRSAMGNDGNEFQFGYFDPVKTIVEEDDDGLRYYGQWMMTKKQREQASELKRAHPSWGWSECFKEAGGIWQASNMLYIPTEELPPPVDLMPQE